MLDAIPVSENKRRLTKKVFAEINQNQWAGLNVYEIAGMSEKDMQAFALSLQPGRSKVTNQPLKIHNINPQFDMAGNLNQLRDLTLNLLSACKVPSFLMNYEQITNRATTEAVLIAWQTNSTGSRTQLGAYGDVEVLVSPTARVLLPRQAVSIHAHQDTARVPVDRVRVFVRAGHISKQPIRITYHHKT